MKHTLSLIILLAIHSVGYAATKNEFAYGYNLEVDGDGAIYSLPLPEEVYRGIARADRGDVRVFNSQGVSVPQVLRSGEQILTAKQEASSIPFFPLYASSDAKGGSASVENVHITTNEQGAVIDINYGKAEVKSRPLSGYLLDLSALEVVPNALELQWPATQADFVLEVRVEGSDDLNHWTSLVSSATLSHLQYGAHQLIQQRLELPVRKEKYLRVSWQKPGELLVEKVTAQFPETRLLQPRQWTNVQAQDPGIEADKEKIYVFDAQAYLPVDRVSIQLPQHNTVVRGILESSDAAAGPWTQHYQGVLYDLQQQGTTLVTPAITVPVTVQRYWRLRVPADEPGLRGVPTLKLGWIAEQLLFTAQGEAPFILAFGSYQVQPASTVLGQLLHQDGVDNNGTLIKPARLGARISLGGATQLVPPPPPLPWKKWILWAVLVVGVIILATMAYRLVKQMNATGST